MDSGQPIALDGALGAATREHRTFLVDLAFRMLGDIGGAEDAVQEGFIRLMDADVASIDDVRGWLIVVVSRICLDDLRSARTRHRSDGPLPPDPGPPAPDPVDRITLDDHIGMALLVVLQRLSPPERAVFVLHDVFQLPFDEIGTVVGRTPAACRKLASRARAHVAAATGPSRFAVEPAAQRELSELFIAACAGGDLEALVGLLDPDVTGHADLGPGFPPQPVQVGRTRVARNLIRFLGGATLVSCPIGGRPGVLAYRDRQLYAMLALDVRDGVIIELDAVADPGKVAHLGLRLS